ncbi:MAG: xanthine dehydrogenase family protein subunit M [Rhizobium sp.]|nr:MAG: xanthine dehydrogenase family protein subunit M [Rhizobium sp.]
MKASAFSYTRASSVVDALELLARHGDQAKVLSGGQSLMPALNLRLSAPDLLIDIGAIPELRGVTVANGVLRIGALTRHVDVLMSADIAKHAPLLTEAVAHVAHPAIRNRGTFGGSLAHADPASELPACVIALDADIIVRSKDGERRIRAADFFTGIYETRLTPEELLVAVEIPVAKSNAVHFFHEYARRKGDYAIVGLAASGIRNGDVLTNLRLGYFAVGEKATLVDASRFLIGRPVTAAVLAEALVALDAELDPQEDQQATAGMRRYLARQLLAQCVSKLLGRPDLEARVLA